MAGYKYVDMIVEKDKDGIAWLIMNRPEKRNALSPDIHKGMAAALNECEIDPAVKVVVITGAGKAFSAGQDLGKIFRERAAMTPGEWQEIHLAAMSWRWQRLAHYTKPTIAMVNGFCFGGALTPVCACDYVVAADDAVFGLSEVNWGIIPGGQVAWAVSQVMNARDALYYATTGETWTGKEGKALGFVNMSVPKAKLKAETVKLAKKLMLKSALALRYTKEAMRAVRTMDEAQAKDYLNTKSDALKWVDRANNNREEGIKQFLDKKTFRPGFGPMKAKNA